MAHPAAIMSVGAYLPRLRLPRARIAEAVAWINPAVRAPLEGARAVCNWDEDAVTLAVEAARGCLAGGGARSRIDVLALASTTLPFADRDNAAAAPVQSRMPCAGVMRPRSSSRATRDVRSQAARRSWASAMARRPSWSRQIPPMHSP
jgi:3-oxoacyl-[acyl-carrier-protein] synthase III